MFGVVRDLFEPSRVRASLVAALLTTAAGYPRLALWLGGRAAIWLFVVALAWCSFFLWGFVFAWHEKYARRPVFVWRIPARLVLLATACGIVCGGVMLTLLDPVLRRLTPQDYPQTVDMWLAMTLFALALDQLFLGFAPLAFFVRLFKQVTPAVWGTVIFGLTVMVMKINASPAVPSVGIIAALAVVRVVGGWLNLQFYLNGGALLAWWFVLVVQARHLVGFMGEERASH